MIPLIVFGVFYFICLAIYREYVWRAVFMYLGSALAAGIGTFMMALGGSTRVAIIIGIIGFVWLCTYAHRACYTPNNRQNKPKRVAAAKPKKTRTLDDPDPPRPMLSMEHVRLAEAEGLIPPYTPPHRIVLPELPTIPPADGRMVYPPPMD